MSRITDESTIDRVSDQPKEAFRYISIFFDQVKRIINNGLRFSDNFDSKILTLSFSSANTDASLAHGLERVPTGYLVLKRSANMTVYDGSNAWTATNIYLRSSAAGSITVMVY